MEIDISDKIGSSTGTIRDVLRFGMCITGIPRKLQTKNNSVTVVVSVEGKRVRLQLRPQWEKQDGLKMVTGAIIDDAPSDWIKMIMQLEREEEKLWSLTY